MKERTYSKLFKIRKRIGIDFSITNIGWYEVCDGAKAYQHISISTRKTERYFNVDFIFLWIKFGIMICFKKQLDD